MRQGIVIKSTHPYLSFYIGGCSKDWKAGNFVIYNAGRQIGMYGKDLPLPYKSFFELRIIGGAKLHEDQLDNLFFLEEKNIEICIIPILSPPNYNWVNPQIMNPKTLSGLKIIPVENLNYQPWLNLECGLKPKPDFINMPHIIFSGLGGESYFFPFIYPGILELSNSNDIIIGLMYTIATETRSLPIYSKNLLYSEAHNNYYGSVFNVNSMSIGSPVYTSIYDVSTSSCNGYKIIGLVGGIKEFYGNTGGSLISDKSLLFNCLEDYEISLYVIPVVKLPESNEITEIERYAKAIGQHPAL